MRAMRDAAEELRDAIARVADDPDKKGTDEGDVRKMIEGGADVNYNLKTGDPRYNGTPLHKASVVGCVALVKLLLEKGADVEAVRSSTGFGPFGTTTTENSLHLACEHGNTDVVRLLLEAGARPDTCKSVGWARQTPLELARGGGHEAAARSPR
eukprot:CAMPEP_0179298662 /NCGR_PEP_ID=MMETSP0797-20121207/46108_1 /TAXON_ID=47934 /ORGANISM="Dinophysis acuminata, Strain DAEP01" /LENGTH=153 /DNA_ID=CAMNT_0021008055 /DNA_START=49 /DNA_END=510 /DNA_ORIENTATION=+